MTVVITSAEVFSESDAERPCATVQRIGGGKFVAVLYSEGHVAAKVEAEDFDAAVALAVKHGSDVDSQPTTPAEKLNLTRTIREKQDQLDAQRVQIDLLTARIGVLEAVQPEVDVAAREG